ncbi:MAG: MBL fold metallo-hydrolase [Bdellovibrionaceae bacterium]|nr:MBL fold metallo-hydrolase [Pseudobdellovibrionaceae bacterium]
MSHKYPISDHCDGTHFHNLDPNVSTSKSFGEVLKWKLGSQSTDWPKTKTADLVKPQISKELVIDELRVTFINHATVLVQWRGINIITDPVLAEKLGPFSFLNLKRYRDSGVQFKELPKIDYVFISHNHYDHLDLPTLEQIDKRDAPMYIVPLGASKNLPVSFRSRTEELDWWQSAKLSGGDLEITLVPAQHWSRRNIGDTNLSLWGAAVFKAHGRQVYFAGDTGYSNHFQITEKKLGPMDVALLPIGAYEPRWFMKDSHMNPEDAVKAHQDLKSKNTIAIHFGTFRLTDEGIEDPEKDLTIALKKYAVSAKDFSVPKNGQSFLFGSNR